ncbi:MAG: VOC family protein [Amphiplicatus sp.]
MQFIPYLSFDGRCEEAFGYYQKHLGGKIVAMARWGEAPEGQRPEGAEGQKDKIMHAMLEAKGALLMGADAPPNFFQKAQGVCVSVNLDDAEEGERIFNALADGGQVNMPYAETFWAEGFGMCVDKFGVPWMVNCGKPQ